LTSGDLITLALTVAGVGGLLLASRHLKARLKLPRISPWLAMGVYNAIWAAIILADRYTALTLPDIVAPVAVVGGNGVLVNFFGIPTLPKRQKPKKKSAKAVSDPDREPLVPKSKKKRRHKRR
jgi:hypothetical protein